MTPFEKKVAISGIALGGGSLIVAALQYAATPPIDKAPTPPVAVTVVPVVPVPPPPPSKLKQVLTEDTLGRQISYLENIVGPPQTVSGTWRSYDVEGCPLSLNVDSSNQIIGLSMKVSSSCTFEWRDMYHNLTGLASPDQTTIGEFIDVVGLDHIQGCMIYCGNATEGGIFFVRKGSHADDWINIKVGFVDDTSTEVAAASKFADIVNQTFGDRFASGDLNRLCDVREIDWARSTLARTKVEYVEFGYDSSISIKYDDEHDCELSYLKEMQS